MDPIQASSDLTPTAQDPNSDQPKPSGLTDRMSRREMLQRWQENKKKNAASTKSLQNRDNVRFEDLLRKNVSFTTIRNTAVVTSLQLKAKFEKSPLPLESNNSVLSSVMNLPNSNTHRAPNASRSHPKIKPQISNGSRQITPTAVENPQNKTKIDLFNLRRQDKKLSNLQKATNKENPIMNKPKTNGLGAKAQGINKLAQSKQEQKQDKLEDQIKLPLEHEVVQHPDNVTCFQANCGEVNPFSECRNLVQTFGLLPECSDSRSINLSSMRSESSGDNLEEWIARINSIRHESSYQSNQTGSYNPTQSEFIAEDQEFEPNWEEYDALFEDLYRNYKEGKSDWKSEFELLILTKDRNLTHFCIFEGRFKPSDVIGEHFNKNNYFCVLLLQYIRDRAKETPEFRIYESIISQTTPLETLQKELEKFLDSQAPVDLENQAQQVTDNSIIQIEEESLPTMEPEFNRGPANCYIENKGFEGRNDVVGEVIGQSNEVSNGDYGAQLKRNREQFEKQSTLEIENEGKMFTPPSKKSNHGLKVIDINGNQRVQLKPLQPSLSVMNATKCSQNQALAAKNLQGKNVHQSLTRDSLKLQAPQQKKPVEGPLAAQKKISQNFGELVKSKPINNLYGKNVVKPHLKGY